MKSARLQRAHGGAYRPASGWTERTDLLASTSLTKRRSRYLGCGGALFRVDGFRCFRRQSPCPFLHVNAGRPNDCFLAKKKKKEIGGPTCAFGRPVVSMASLSNYTKMRVRCFFDFFCVSRRWARGNVPATPAALPVSAPLGDWPICGTHHRYTTLPLLFGFSRDGLDKEFFLFGYLSLLKSRIFNFAEYTYAGPSLLSMLLMRFFTWLLAT